MAAVALHARSDEASQKLSKRHQNPAPSPTSPVWILPCAAQLRILNHKSMHLRAPGVKRIVAPKVCVLISGRIFKSGRGQGQVIFRRASAAESSAVNVNNIEPMLHKKSDNTVFLLRQDKYT